MLEVRLLGQFDVRRDGIAVEIATRSAQSLLAYLLLNPGTACRREMLAGLLWPDTTEANARGNLRSTLWRLRAALAAGNPSGPDSILADSFTLAFDAAGEYWLDVAVVEKPPAAGQSADELIECVSAYGGDLLPGFYDEWAVLERERLRAVYEDRMQRLLERLVETGRWRDVLEWGERWIALGSVPEPAYRALMLAHGESGDRSRIAAVYARYVNALRDQLGVDPSEQMQILFEKLARGVKTTDAAPAMATVAAPTPALVAPLLATVEGAEPIPAAGESPYKGLSYFDELDAGLFFGRERLTARLLQQLREQRFLAVIGASGSGKSSVVRAGLIPSVRRQGLTVPDDGTNAAGADQIQRGPTWDIHLITPTAHPLEALAVSLTRESESVTATATLIDDLSDDPRSLHLYLSKRASRTAQTVSRPNAPENRDDGAGLLLVVDQFEELFTLCRDEDERLAFIGNLLTATDSAGPLRAVIITLRADFYAHCAPYAALREALERHQTYIGPLSAVELRQAIEEPARQGGWELEPGLVDSLLRDVGEEPGALPLLSHALLETWNRRRGRALTLSGYVASGGVRGAIARTAQGVYEQLSPEQQAVARGIFLGLTELGDGTQDTRRRAARSELIAGSADGSGDNSAEVVLKILTDARLITTSETTVEVAHEALIREWPALREWLSENREALQLHRHLTEAAQAWDKLQRDPGELYRGARLVHALEWGAWSQQAAALNPMEREFLQASKKMAEREAVEREARQRRELEAAQRLAQAERERAQSEARRAESETQRAEEQSRSSARLRLRNRVLTGLGIAALVLAIAAGFFGIQANQTALSAERQFKLSLSRQLARQAASLMASQQYDLAVLLGLEALRQTDTMEARSVLLTTLEGYPPIPHPLPVNKAGVATVSFSHNGKMMATGGNDNTIILWDTATRRPIGQPLVGHKSFVSQVAFSPDDRTLASGSFDNTIILWDVATQQSDGPPIAVYTSTTGPGIKKLPFSPNGSTLEGYITVSFSPDGRTLATGGPDVAVRLWDLATRRLTGQPLTGHSKFVTQVAFSPDGHTLAAASTDQTIILWDVATRQLIGSPLTSGDVTEVYTLAYSHDGKLLASASFDGAVILWNAVTRRPFGQPLLGHTGLVWQVAFSPDDHTLVSGGVDGTVRQWDIATQQPVGPPLAGQAGAVYSVDVSPDGNTLASANDDGTVILWDTATRQPTVQTLAGHPGAVTGVAFGPAGGKSLASGDGDGRIILWDLATGKPLDPPFPQQAAGVTSIAFSSDGKTLASGSRDSTILLWDAFTHQALGPPLTGHKFSVTSVAFSPDNKQLASGGQDGTVRLWDLATRQAIGPPLVGQTWLRSVAFSPDGRILASGGLTNWIRLRDVATGQAIGQALAGHNDSVNSLAFSPDGKILVSGSADGTIRLWDVSTGQPLGQPLTRHKGAVLSVSISRDGTILASAGEDKTVRLWDMATRQPLGQPLTRHTGAVNSLAFSPDGNSLATGSSDSTILLWDLSLSSWEAAACEDAERNLSQAEWAQYLPGQPYQKTCEQWPAGN